MKNSFSFYQGAQGGLQNFGQRLIGGAAARQKSFDSTLNSLSQADLRAGQAAEHNAKAERMAAGGAELADEPTFLSNLSGISRPLVQKAIDFQRNGNWGVIQPLTPNDDEGNPNAPITLDLPGDAALSPQAMQMVNRARQTRAATMTGKESTPEQIAKAQGEFQGQGITDNVQADIAGGLMDRASARNQGGKLGQQIKLFDNAGDSGAIFSNATGNVVTDNALAQSTIAKQLAQAQEASAKASTAGDTRIPAGYRAAANGALEPIPGGPADIRVGEAAERRQERIDAGNARTQERTAAGDAKRSADLDKRVNQFSATLEKSGVPAFDSVLGDIKATLSKFDGQDVPGLGATGQIPGFLLSDEGKDVRQKIATLRNIVLKDRSGAAVTDQELRRLLEELGTGVFTTDDQFRNAITNIEKRFGAIKQNAVAGVDDDVLHTYKDRGGMAIERGPNRGNAPAAGAPATPAAPGARPPLSSFVKPGAAAPAPARAVQTSNKPGQVSSNDRIAILSDEYRAESARPAASAVDQERKAANLAALARELQALRAPIPGGV